MAKDFREYLDEVSRHDVFGRVFKELAVGKVMLSFQASVAHGSYPAETLDDVYAYTRWEVSMRSAKPPIDVPKAGAWSYLKNNYWARPFSQPDFQRAIAAENIPTKDCQQILEDVIEYGIVKGHIESESEIRLLDADEEIKKNVALSGGTGCGGCGGQRTIKQK